MAAQSPDSSQQESLMVSPPVMRRFALFVDGLSRAVILPFGPTLVHRLVFGNTEIKLSSWSGVAIHFACLLAVFILGRWTGFILSRSFTGSKHLHILVARLGGAAMSLHVFAYGAGLSSVGWLLLIRLVAAALSGMLNGITSDIALPEDGWAHELPHDLLLEDRSISDARRRESYLDVAPSATKLYLTGFAVSILSGGLLFRPATKDSTFRALTGTYMNSWSPWFLIGLAIGVEIILRCLFSLARTTAAQGIPSSTGKVRKAIVRIVAPSHDIMKPLITMAISEEDELEEDSFPDMVETTPIHRRRSFSYSTPGRSRVESFTSVEDFFDCYSVFSDSDPEADELLNPIDSHAIAKYVEGRCVYDDKSPAYVNAGDCAAETPQSYLDLYKGNTAKAKKAWDATQTWRRDLNVWKIHTMPNVWFSQIKQAYPHFVHGHSKQGYPVVYERPGQMNLKELFRSGCEISDMLHHYTFFIEFIANVVCQSEDVKSKLGSNDWGFMVVLDVKGAGLSSLSGDVLKYLKQAGDTNTSHYPLTLRRAFIINSPFWLSGAWSTVKGILPESVTVDILSEANAPNALREFIDDDQIPPEFGGSSSYALGSHPSEVQLKELVDKASSGPSVDDSAIVSSRSLDLTPIQLKGKSVDMSPVASPARFSALHPKQLEKPLRRRIGSVDRPARYRSFSGGSIDYRGRTQHNGEHDIFSIFTTLHGVLSMIQGMLEAGVPLWLMSPTSVGGLGYNPSRSGVSIFCTCMILLMFLRTKCSNLVFRLPCKAPMRAFRIGIGTQTTVLLLLVFLICHSKPDTRTHSVVVAASVTIALSCLAISGVFGYSSSIVLHRTAAEAFVVVNSMKHQSRLGRYLGEDRFHQLCSNGELTNRLSLAGQIIGFFVVAPLWAWAIPSEQPAPLDATIVACFTAIISASLYVYSLSLQINIHGEFAPHPSESRGGSRRIFPFLLEIVSVAAEDVASLFSEASRPKSEASESLPRTRAMSDVSGIDLMERGEERQGCRARKAK